MVVNGDISTLHVFQGRCQTKQSKLIIYKGAQTFIKKKER